MSQRAKLWAAAAASLLCVQAFASLTLSRGFTLVALSDLAQLLMLLSGMFAVIHVALANHGRVRVFWALMAVGIGFWLTYQVLWCYFEVLLRRDVPNPFAGDVVLFLHLVPMTAALALQPHAPQDSRSSRLGLLDFAMLLVWWLYLYVLLVIPWQYVHHDEVSYGKNLNVLYLIEKLVLLGVLAALWNRSQNFWRSIYASWFGCTLTYSLCSYLANWAIEKRIYFSGSVYDVPLAASMTWVTWIGLKAMRYGPKQQAVQPSVSRGVWVARLGMITIFTLPLFAAWSMFDLSIPPKVRAFRLFVTLAGMLVLGTMVFFKQYLLDRELVRLLDASRNSLNDLQRLQTQLVQSEKMASLGQLVGGAAHELNNPLTAMMGYSDLLSATELDSEQQPLAQQIESQIRRTRALVSSMLSFSKQAPTEKSLLDLNSVIQTAIRLHSLQGESGNFKIETILAGELPMVMGDSNQILQMCMQVTRHALQSVPEQDGRLQVKTRRENNSVVVEFSIRDADTTRVFAPFAVNAPAAQGSTGGLNVGYGIIQEHNGRVSCESASPGEATLRIDFPVWEEAEGGESHQQFLSLRAGAATGAHS